LGKLISALDIKDKESIIEKVAKKIKKLPNTEVLDLWLQRLTLKFDKTKEYEGELSKKIEIADTKIWNSDWLNDDIQKIINETSIINKEEIEKMDEYPHLDETALFESKNNYY
jgi:hypothetical protein